LVAPLTETLIRGRAQRIMGGTMNLGQHNDLVDRYPIRRCAWCGWWLGCLDTDPELILHIDCERRLAERDPEAVHRFLVAAADGRHADATAALRRLRS
jgi:hypothetical protein